MENNNRNRERENSTDNDFSIGEMLLRVLITAIVVAIAAFLTPGFTIIWTLEFVVSSSSNRSSGLFNTKIYWC